MNLTGQEVRASGMYRVQHAPHRLPEEVSLVFGALFPRCCKCEAPVEFEPSTLAPIMTERRGQIVLYELPCLDMDVHTKVA